MTSQPSWEKEFDESVKVKLSEMLEHYSRQDESFNEYPDDEQTKNLLVKQVKNLLSSSRTELLKELKGKAEMMKLNADPSLSSLKRKDGKVLDYYACKACDLCIDDFIALLEKEIK